MATGVVGNLLLDNSSMLCNARGIFSGEEEEQKYSHHGNNNTERDSLHPVSKPSLGQKLLEIQRLHPVCILGPSTDTETDKIIASLKQLDSLIDAIKYLKDDERIIGSSPGFYTSNDIRSSDESEQPHSSFLWAKPSGPETHDDGSSSNVYDVLDLNKNMYSDFKLPVPSPADALKCYEKIREVWKARLEWTKTVNRGECTENDVCACIKCWKHCRGNVLLAMANQVMEQEMVRDASSIIPSLLSSCKGEESWNEMYRPESCPDPRNKKSTKLPLVPTKVFLLPNRNKYISTFVENALAAKVSVDISTSYLFHHDPAHRYILMNVIPFIAQKYGVNVRILVDLLVVESNMIKSAFVSRRSDDSAAKPSSSLEPGCAALRFLANLPEEAPLMSMKAFETPANPKEFIESLAQLYANIPSIQLKWWCARDARTGYRVKSHTKCHIFDEFSTIVGGSNITPVMSSESSDCDLFLSGEVVKEMKQLFNKHWDTIAFSSSPVVDQLVAPSPSTIKAIKSVENFEWLHNTPTTAYEKPPPSLISTTIASSTTMVTNAQHHPSSIEDKLEVPKLDATPSCLKDFEWDDSQCFSTIVSNQSSSKGEDSILRNVLGAIHGAKKKILMVFGHCNIPRFVSEALKSASEDRGVEVELLVNSQFSSDLRTGQKDLYLSLRDLLTIAPKTKVWAVTPKSIIMQKEKEKGIQISATATAAAKEEKYDDDESLPFVHAKYVLIDDVWAAVGGWNLWTRSAFYEFDVEIFLESKDMCKKLEQKLRKEIESNGMRIEMEDIDSGGNFLPKGCSICEGFGTFFDEKR